jgi:CHAD domain-containing protein
MAKPRDVPGLGPDVPFRESAARTVEVRTEELFSFSEGVLDTEDIERVHDMRVASRRLRAALEIFAPAFPKKPHRSVLRDVKRLADVLGERRDPDVQIATLRKVEAGLTGEDAPGIESLVDALRAGQAHANELLAGELDRIESDQLKSRLVSLAVEARAA